MKEVTEIKVGQKYQQKGHNAFGRVCHIDNNDNVFFIDKATNELNMCKRQDFIDIFELVAEKPSKNFQKNFTENLLLSLFLLLVFLAIFALCQYIGFNAFAMITGVAVTSAVLAVWESYKE